MQQKFGASWTCGWLPEVWLAVLLDLQVAAVLLLTQLELRGWRLVLPPHQEQRGLSSVWTLSPGRNHTASSSEPPPSLAHLHLPFNHFITNRENLHKVISDPTPPAHSTLTCCPLGGAIAQLPPEQTPTGTTLVTPEGWSSALTWS